MFNVPGIKPFWVVKGIVELPIFCGDLAYLSWRGSNVSLDTMAMEDDGLRIFTFHPIHVFLNTESIEHYERAKAFYHDPAKNCESKSLRSR